MEPLRRGVPIAVEIGVERKLDLEPLLDRTDAGVIPGDGLRCPDGDQRVRTVAVPTELHSELELLLRILERLLATAGESAAHCVHADDVGLYRRRRPVGDEREGLFRQLPGLIVAADVPEVPAA